MDKNNSVYPWVLNSWPNFPSLCFLVFSKVFSIHMSCFCNWEKIQCILFKKKKKDTELIGSLLCVSQVSYVLFHVIPIPAQ